MSLGGIQREVVEIPLLEFDELKHKAAKFDILLPAAEQAANDLLAVVGRASPELSKDAHKAWVLFSATVNALKNSKYDGLRWPK